MTLRLLLCLLVWTASALSSRAQPAADHHQHLFSPALAALISPAPPAEPTAPITAADLIRHLDAAGIKRAAVLSTAYIFGQPSRKVENEREKVMADNDWTAAQVAQFPGRLAGLCGIRLHFGNAVVESGAPTPTNLPRDTWAAFPRAAANRG